MNPVVTIRISPFVLLGRDFHEQVVSPFFAGITTADRVHVSHDASNQEVIEIRGVVSRL